MAQATNAITEFDRYKLPQLGGSKIPLSYIFKGRFSILSMHSAIASELANVHQSFRFNNELDIKAYPSTDKGQRFTTLHIISNAAQDVGKAKAAVERILNGHTARGGKDIVWHDFFVKTEGMVYLNSLGKQHDVFTYRDAKRLVLRLYGAEEYKVFVDSALLKTIEDLVVCKFKSN